MEILKSDVVIIGSGVAGLSCALNIDSDKKIILITKKELEDSNSYLAQGGISIRKGESDRETFIEDTMKAGHYENIKEAVEVLVDESEDALKFLVENNVDFNREDGEILFTKEGGHSTNRIAYCDDIAGECIMNALIAETKKRKNIEIITNSKMEDLLILDNKCYGIYAKSKDKDYKIYAGVTVLATGGMSGIYKNTTNFSHIKGDGIALAIKHGIDLRDISYVQIHPTALYENSDDRRFLVSEAVRGEGGHLLNQKHERFTDELKPRDIVSSAILKEMEKDKSDYEYLDMSVIETDIKERFPNIYKKLIEIDIDPYKEPVPIVPAAHYTMGGIKVDLDGKTSADNLYAVGEVASTGVHGKNRLASNSLLESVVYGTRAARSINDSKIEIKEVDADYSDLMSYEEECKMIRMRMDLDAKNKELSN